MFLPIFHRYKTLLKYKKKVKCRNKLYSNFYKIHVLKYTQENKVYSNLYKTHVLKYAQETPSGGSGELTSACHSFSMPTDPLR